MKSHIDKLLLFLSVTAIIWLGAGCQTAKLVETKAVHIGVIMPQSGNFALYGKNVISGINYFVDQYNRQHKVKIVLHIVDNHSTAAGTVKAFAQLMSDTPKLPVIIGAYSSNNTVVLKPFANRYKIPIVSPTSTSDIVTLNNPYMFRTCFSVSEQGAALGRFVKRQLKIDRLGILINIDADGEYSKGLSRSFAKAYKAAGGKVALKLGYSRRYTKDFQGFIQQFIEHDIDAIFVPTYLPIAVKVVKAARQKRFKGKIFGSDGWDEPSLLTSAGDYLNHCFFSTMFSAKYSSLAMKRFIVGYKRRHRGRIPGVAVAQGYDTIAVIASLVDDGKLQDVAKQLGKVTDFPGVTGKITIKPDGNAMKTVFIKRINKLPSGYFIAQLIGTIPPMKNNITPKQK